MDIEYIKELINQEYENEFVEFKHNWFEADELGEYISALSNSAAEMGVDFGYFIFGVDNKTHELLGTTFNPDIEIKNEPLKHYLARKLNPSISFKFEELIIDSKRIIVLSIPAAKRVITEYNKERFIRIGSSKELLRKYPDREADLWIVLRNGLPTIVNTESPNQDLSFAFLKGYYLSKGLPLNNETFEDNLHLFVPSSKKYNLLAYLLSDKNDITCRVSIFSGKRKSDNLYSLNDFGNKCLLVTIDQILNFIESFNIIKVDETNRIVERNDIPLFDSKSLREAVLNAFIHNDWVDLNAPMISIFVDRIEILSYGSLPPKQTVSGFFAGKSKPRCQELSDVFLQLRISERSGRGVTRVVDTYSKEAFDIESDFIKVTIPFSSERYLGVPSEQKSEQKSEQVYTGKASRVKEAIVSEMRNNASITTAQLMSILGLGKTIIQKYIRELTADGIITHHGTKRGGYWEVLDHDQ